MRRLGPLFGGVVALVHSTSWRWPTTIGSESRSPGWILVLGAPLGVLAWACAALARGAGLPPMIASLIGLATLSAASAALVERGLAERIEAMQSHTRSAAARAGGATVVLVFVLLARAAAISALPPARWFGVLVATAVAGRWSAIFLQALGDPILDDDAPRSLVAAPAPGWLVAALSLAVAAIAVLALGKAGIAALAIAAALSFVLGLDAQRRDRGLSAPVVATAAAIGELSILLVSTI
jgi:adenosylcobinamide-GDP ribazoletransferase